MAVRDRPGSLLASLQPFAERDINLHKLESRPRRGKPFEYVFYVDLMAAADAPEVEDALAAVAEHTSLLRVLGSYRSAGDAGLNRIRQVPRCRYDGPHDPGRSFLPTLPSERRHRRGRGLGARWSPRSAGRWSAAAMTPAAPARLRLPRSPCEPRSPRTERSEGVTTFRGNATRSYYGRGPVPLDPVVRWQHPEARSSAPSRSWVSTSRSGAAPGGRASPTWSSCRAGASRCERAPTTGSTTSSTVTRGSRFARPLVTQDLAKGSATTDPDGFPLYYAGSRDGHLRVVALDRDEPETLWSIDGGTSVPPPAAQRRLGRRAARDP